jgi:hypothetical protein
MGGWNAHYILYKEYRGTAQPTMHLQPRQARDVSLANVLSSSPGKGLVRGGKGLV